MLRSLTLLGAMTISASFGQTGWPCVAGRAVDPAYIQVAENTGGQVFMFDRSEAGRSLVLMRETRKHEEVVSRAMGTLAAGFRDFEIPVDTSIESLLFAVSLQCLQGISIYRPSGAELLSSDAGVDDNQFKAGRILVMSRPEPGAWRVRITGSGLFFAVVSANSTIALNSAEFVEVGGRPGHQGYFPIKGSARLNVPQNLSVSVSGAPVTELRLISSSGETLQQIELEARAGTEEDWMASVTPSQPTFRVTVEGRDASGFPYQRVYPRLLKAVP
jgi:hypothetical protein